MRSAPAELAGARFLRALAPRLLLALTLLLASGCGERERPAGDAPAEAPAPAPEASPPAEPSPAAPQGGSAGAIVSDAPAPPDACERAQACCPAYVAALPPSGRGEASEACSTLSMAMELEGRPRDEACQGALEGFRASLRATGLEVPEVCRAP